MEFILPAMKVLTYVGIFTIVLGVLLLSGIVRGRQGPLNYIIASIICIALGIFLLTIRSTGKIGVDDSGFTLKAPLLKTRVIPAGDIARAWVEDLAGSEWYPARKTSGAAAGSLRSGWFKLRNGRRAFVVLHGGRALCLEDRNGQVYLLGTEDFEGFLSTVKRRFPRMVELLH